MSRPLPCLVHTTTKELPALFSASKRASAHNTGMTSCRWFKERGYKDKKSVFKGCCMLIVIMFVITGWTRPCRPSRNSRGNWNWTSRTKSNLIKINKYIYIYIVLCYWLCYLLSAFLCISAIKLSHYINLQGDMGFQGRAGPPGPPGLGEHGLPVSKEESKALLWPIFEYCIYVFVVSIFVGNVICRERLWPEHFLGEIWCTLTLFTGASRTTRCSRR